MAVIHLLALLAALLALHHVTYYAVPLSTLFLLAPVFALLTAFASLPVTVALGLLGDRVVASSSNDDNDDHRRRRTRLQRALRPLAFATPAAWSIVQVRDRWEMEQAAAAAARVEAAALSSSIADATMLTTDPPSPTTISAGAEGGGLPAILRAPLDNILARILGDFVHPWYDRLSPSPAFPRALDSVLRDAGASFLAQMTANKDKEGGGGEKSLDLATLVVATLVPRLTRHLAAFARAERALLKAGGGVGGPGGAATTSNGVGSAAGGSSGGRGRASSSVVDPLLLARSYDDDTRLHRAVSSRSLETRPAQEEHLRMLADIVLRRVLPERERKSSAVRIIAREIVAVAVLAPVVEMLSDPDFWNR
jgi:sorting nexin-25